MDKRKGSHGFTTSCYVDCYTCLMIDNSNQSLTRCIEELKVHLSLKQNQGHNVVLIANQQ